MVRHLRECWNGRQARLRCVWFRRVGSSPISRTKKEVVLTDGLFFGMWGGTRIIKCKSPVDSCSMRAGPHRHLTVCLRHIGNESHLLRKSNTISPLKYWSKYSIIQLEKLELRRDASLMTNRIVDEEITLRCINPN